MMEPTSWGGLSLAFTSRRSHAQAWTSHSSSWSTNYHSHEHSCNYSDIFLSPHPNCAQHFPKRGSDATQRPRFLTNTSGYTIQVLLRHLISLGGVSTQPSRRAHFNLAEKALSHARMEASAVPLFQSFIPFETLLLTPL